MGRGDCGATSQLVLPFSSGLSIRPTPAAAAASSSDTSWWTGNSQGALYTLTGAPPAVLPECLGGARSSRAATVLATWGSPRSSRMCRGRHK